MDLLILLWILTWHIKVELAAWTYQSAKDFCNFSLLALQNKGNKNLFILPTEPGAELKDKEGPFSKFRITTFLLLCIQSIYVFLIGNSAF